ncbi:MAG: ABC transporter permease [bacterium]|nr:ABC transporter permease [bacterium]
MKPSGFNSYFTERLQLIKINTINTYQIELAYFSQRWASLLSTLTFTLSYILLINIVYNNVHFIASYSKNDSLFLSVVGQINYYIMWTWGTTNIQNLITFVNRGDLDLILIKPLPTLFYITFRRIGLVGFLTQGLPTLILLAAFVNWSEIYVAPLNLLLGIIVFICGQIALNSFQFMFAIPVFWQGESTELFNVSMEFLGVPTQIPFEALYSGLKIVFTTIIPVAISTVICTSVLLGKSDPRPLVLVSIFVAVVSSILKKYLWNVAMKQYTSASS